MGNQFVSAKIQLGNWIGPRSAEVGGDLVRLQNLLRKEFHNINIDTSRKPHIEITENAFPNDKPAYASIQSREIDISDVRNWDVTGRAIMLKTGKTCHGKDTHFTMIFSADLARLPRETINKAIANAVCNYQS